MIVTKDTDQSIELAAKTAREHGAITCALYSTDADVIRKAEDATAEAGVPLSCNLTGQIFVNQSAAFSDFHGSGCNPAGNATLCDGAFVASRFRTVQSRVLVPDTADAGAKAELFGCAALVDADLQPFAAVPEREYFAERMIAVGMAQPRHGRTGDVDHGLVFCR